MILHSKRATIPFHLLLKPVGASCNLACQYCYYPQASQHQPNMIDLNFLETLTKDYIQSQPHATQEINFVWQGGEPLISGIHFYAQALYFQKKYAPVGVTISNSLQTNASLLTEEWCLFLKKHQFIIGVSIDGPAHIHDQYRLSRGSHTNPSKGSYQSVLAGIQKLQKHQIEFNALVIVHDAVANHAIEIYEHLISLGITFIQFQPLMQEGLARQNYFQLSAQNWGKFLSDLYNYWIINNHFGHIFIMNIEHAFAQYFMKFSPTCVHSQRCGTNLSIETKGQLYACDHLMNSAHYLGDFGSKDLRDFVNQSIQYDFGMKKSSRLECQQCQVKMMCQGGCPTHLDPISHRNKLCDGYFQFFNHLLSSVSHYSRDQFGFQQWRKQNKTQSMKSIYQSKN